MESLNIYKALISAKKQNIAVIGHMGSGKSVFSQKLAKKLNIPIFDSDKEITKIENISINRIFAEKGEKYFREIEEKTILNILQKKNVIISLGGGSILNKKVRDKVSKVSLTIFLDVKINILYRRLKNSKNRPLLKDCNILTKLKKLDKDRRKYFLESDILINNSKSLDESINKFYDYFLLNEKNNKN